MHYVRIPYHSATEDEKGGVRFPRTVRSEMKQFLNNTSGQSWYEYLDEDDQSSIRSISCVEFSFENSDDAVIFKLTFGGTTH